jgi:hypothetical protein
LEIITGIRGRCYYSDNPYEKKCTFKGKQSFVKELCDTDM